MSIQPRCVHAFLAGACLACGRQDPPQSPRKFNVNRYWHTWSAGRLIRVDQPWQHVGAVIYEPGHIRWEPDYRWARFYSPYED